MKRMNKKDFKVGFFSCLLVVGIIGAVLLAVFLFI